MSATDYTIVLHLIVDPDGADLPASLGSGELAVEAGRDTAGRTWWRTRQALPDDPWHDGPVLAEFVDCINPLERLAAFLGLASATTEGSAR
jgi:hypothetical protein